MAGDRARIEDIVSLFRKMWLFFVMSHITYLGIGWYLARTARDVAPVDDTLVIGLGLASLALVVAVFALRRVMFYGRLGSIPAPDLTKEFLKLELVTLSMAEAIGIFGLIVVHIGGTFAVQGLFATLAIALTVACFPNVSKAIHAWEDEHQTTWTPPLQSDL